MCSYVQNLLKYNVFVFFSEASEGRAELEDELYDDVVDFLQFICPDRNYMSDKKITGFYLFLRKKHHFFHIFFYKLL